LCGLVAVAALLVARTLLPDGGGVMFAAGFLVAYAGLLKQYLFKTFPSNLNKEEVSVFVRDCIMIVPGTPVRAVLLLFFYILVFIFTAIEPLIGFGVLLYDSI
jgi:hypothetical protein